VQRGVLSAGGPRIEHMSESIGSVRVGRWVEQLGALVEDVDDAERIDQIRLLEKLKSAAAAAQARVTAAFARSQRAAQTASGVPAKDLGKGVASQVALANPTGPS
jgi:hypothetical protein